MPTVKQNEIHNRSLIRNEQWDEFKKLQKEQQKELHNIKERIRQEEKDRIYMQHKSFLDKCRQEYLDARI